MLGALNWPGAVNPPGANRPAVADAVRRQTRASIEGQRITGQTTSCGATTSSGATASLYNQELRANHVVWGDSLPWPAHDRLRTTSCGVTRRSG